jgi:hypothetical protein
MYSNSFRIYIRRQSTGTWSAWHLVDTAFSSGDTITFASDSYIRWIGDWRTARDLWFTIPLERTVSNLNATISGSIIVTCNGSRNTVNIANASSTDIYETDGGITVHIGFASDQSFATTGYPATIQSYGVTITFA